MKGKLSAVCISGNKGEQKSAVPEAYLCENFGLEADAHGGSWHRQVSILSKNDIDSMLEKGLDLKPGAFGENLIVEEIDLSSLGLGTRLRIGVSAEIIITQIGKVCHSHCAIYDQAGDCIMPRVGLFGRCVAEGRVSPGDDVKIMDAVGRDIIQVVVLTISDSCSKGEAEDTAGPAVEELLREQLDAHVYCRKILADDFEQIKDSLIHYSNGHSLDLIITVGGTGLSPRDVTPEATRSVVERLSPGLDEAMRASSLCKTPKAMLSRGVSGVRGSTLIINIPGSERGARENLKAVLPVLPHAVEVLRGDTISCG